MTTTATAPTADPVESTDDARARRWLRHAEQLYRTDPVAAASAAHIANGYARLAQAAAGLPFDPTDSHEPPAETLGLGTTNH